MTWSRHPALSLLPIPLGGLIAVYHPASGETHLLSPASARLLERLGRCPATVESLSADMGDAVSDIAARLVELFDAGLIVPT